MFSSLFASSNGVIAFLVGLAFCAMTIGLVVHVWRTSSPTREFKWFIAGCVVALFISGALISSSFTMTEDDPDAPVSVANQLAHRVK